jgi:hypothetical protein
MILQLLILIAELLLLFLVSKILIEHLYGFFFLIFRRRPIAVSIVTLLVFPGTVIHELSHLFTAEILGVRTGGLTLAPEAIQDPEVRAGSVMIARTDPLRRALIGTAPFFTGIITLTALSYYFTPQLQALWNAVWSGAPITGQSVFLTAGIIYLIFAISNSMFSSKEDMKGFPAIAIVFGLIMATLYILGIRITLTEGLTQAVTMILGSLTRSLGLVLAVNCIGLLLMRIFLTLMERIFHVRMIRQE